MTKYDHDHVTAWMGGGEGGGEREHCVVYSAIDTTLIYTPSLEVLKDQM